MRRLLLLATCLLAGCLDSVGPRVRPGGSRDSTSATPQSAAMLWYELQPRVITQGETDSVRITVAVTGNPEIVDVQTRSGVYIGLPRISAGLYSTKVATPLLMFGYRVGDLHNLIGFIEVVGSTATNQYIAIANVKDATVPTVDPKPVALGMQATTHVVNIRLDSLYLGAAVPASPLKTFYSQFGDDYALAAVVEQVRTERPRTFTLVSNNVRGIGLPIFSDGAKYGSANALEGIIDFTNDAEFDLAERSNVHDIAHRWINYLTRPSLATGRPHWPLSDLAYGIMGWQSPITHDDSIFPFDVSPQTNGTYILRGLDTPRLFNDMELYLMGLLPGDSVLPHIVFLNQNQQGQVRSGGVLQGPVDTVTIAKIAAQDGARVPAAGSAPRRFQMVTIVLSRNGLLSRDEMSYFDYQAARGERETALPYFTGQARGTTLPFYAATSARGTLVTTLAPR